MSLIPSSPSSVRLQNFITKIAKDLYNVILFHCPGYFLVISYYVSLIQNCVFRRNCLPILYHICLIFLNLKFTVFFLCQRHFPRPFAWTKLKLSDQKFCSGLVQVLTYVYLTISIVFVVTHSSTFIGQSEFNPPLNASLNVLNLWNS